MNIWVLMAVTGGIFLIQHSLIRFFAFRGLKYTRQVSSKRVTAGEKILLTEVLRNDRLFFLPWVLAEAKVSRYCVFGARKDLEVSGEMYHRSFFSMLPFRQIRRLHQVTMTRRGRYNLGNLTLTAGDLVGIGCVSREIREDLTVWVCPAPAAIEVPRLPVISAQGSLSVLKSLLTDPNLICGIRNYQPGDPLREIHWPATGRTGSLQVKVHDPSAHLQLMVILNSQLRPDQWGSLTELEEATVEYGISAAAAILRWVLSEGGAAGFASDMPCGDGDDGLTLLPDTGRETLEKVLLAMSGLQFRRQKKFLTFLEEMKGYSEMDLLILSAYDDPALRAAMKELEQYHRSVSLFVYGREASA